ncbi:MAG: hypothetical protein GY941_24520 [Planctomycetes bacterium]|nr:hypothetical protein [Planctomycetota bacterium]
MAVFLYGCGAAHIKTDMQSPDLRLYEKFYIRDVKVYSNEPNAKTNIKLQRKMEYWASFTRKELEGYIRESHYSLVDSVGTESEKVLIADIDVNVVYGNRALRWAVGFGAGKGGVDSLLTVNDAQTGKIKFKATSDSDLSMGGAGGDIDDVLKGNIRKLIDQYRKSLSN